MSDPTDERRRRLYERYADTHAGLKSPGDESRTFERDIFPHLPPGDRELHLVVDIGCGQGRLVEQLIAHGYTAAQGIDISPQQVELAHAAGIRNVECGDYRETLVRYRGELGAVIATDFLEHFTKDEVLSIFDDIHRGLAPGGVFVVRSPNATSPFFGNYQFGDFTHEVTFTPRSFAQIAATAGFQRTRVFACTPYAHGVKSAVRVAIWRAVSSALKLALAAETGATGHIVTQNFIGVAVK